MVWQSNRDFSPYLIRAIENTLNALERDEEI